MSNQLFDAYFKNPNVAQKLLAMADEVEAGTAHLSHPANGPADKQAPHPGYGPDDIQF